MNHLTREQTEISPTFKRLPLRFHILSLFPHESWDYHSSDLVLPVVLILVPFWAIGYAMYFMLKIEITHLIMGPSASRMVRLPHGAPKVPGILEPPEIA